MGPACASRHHLRRDSCHATIPDRGADWGCKDGDHRAWGVLEVESREEVRNIVPHAFQAHAKIVQLNHFTRTDLEDLLQRHKS
jgi:hypothetical protein